VGPTAGRGQAGETGADDCGESSRADRSVAAPLAVRRALPEAVAAPAPHATFVMGTIPGAIPTICLEDEMRVDGYAHFGGRHGGSAAIKNMLAFAGVANPATGEPFSEALCFGIAGGIGAGYSFCPSVPRYGSGSGVSVVGRYKSYATDAAWYQGFFDRIGAS